jgi:hypothetical protein
MGVGLRIAPAASLIRAQNPITAKSDPQANLK